MMLRSYFHQAGDENFVACKGSQWLMIIKFWMMADYDHSTETTAVELYVQNNK